MLRRLACLAVLPTLVGGIALVGPAQVAQAAPPAQIAQVASSPDGFTAPAAISWRGPIRMNCVGFRVDRCAYLETSANRQRIRARANIIDPSSVTGNYRVAVNNVQLQRLTSNGWRTVRGSLRGDLDGWFPVWDNAPSWGRACRGGVTYRAIAFFHWRPLAGSSGSGDRWYTSNRWRAACL